MALERIRDIRTSTTLVVKGMATHQSPITTPTDREREYLGWLVGDRCLAPGCAAHRCVWWWCELLSSGDISHTS